MFKKEQEDFKKRREKWVKRQEEIWERQPAFIRSQYTKEEWEKHKEEFVKNQEKVAKVGGPALMVGGALDIIMNAEQKTYDKAQQEYVDGMSKLMNTSAGDKYYPNVAYDKKRELVDWALSHSTDPEEIKALRGIQESNYSVQAYLEPTTPELKLDPKEINPEEPGQVTEQWKRGVRENIENGIDAQFFGQLEEQKLAMEKEQPRSAQPRQTPDQGQQPRNSTGRRRRIQFGVENQGTTNTQGTTSVLQKAGIRVNEEEQMNSSHTSGNGR